MKTKKKRKSGEVKRTNINPTIIIPPATYLTAPPSPQSPPPYVDFSKMSISEMNQMFSTISPQRRTLNIDGHPKVITRKDIEEYVDGKKQNTRDFIKWFSAIIGLGVLESMSKDTRSKKNRARRATSRKKKMKGGVLLSSPAIAAYVAIGFSIYAANAKERFPSRWLNKSKKAAEKVKKEKRKFLLKKFKKSIKNLKLSKQDGKYVMKLLYNNHPKLFPDLADDKIKERRNERIKQKRQQRETMKNMIPTSKLQERQPMPNMLPSMEFDFFCSGPC